MLYVAGPFYSTNVYQNSDLRLKKNINNIVSAIDKINRLNGVEYEFKREEFADRNLPQGKQYGVIAQQVEEVLPEAVKSDDEGIKSVAYAQLIPVLIEAIKAQQKEIDELKMKLRN
jgi:hypothetical protein